MIFQVEYSNKKHLFFARSDVNDKRLLSIAYHYIEFFVNNSSSKIDFRNYYSGIIFGFCSHEKWGTWSLGGKSCFEIPNISPDCKQVSLLLNCHHYSEAFKSCKIFIRSSNGLRGSFRITNHGDFIINLKKPILFFNTRLVIGDFSRKSTSHNVTFSSSVPQVTIILLNKDKELLSLLSALAAGSSRSCVNFEILCVDNGSSPESLERLKKPEVPMRLIKLRANKGFGPANNIVISEARGEYLLFLNNDAFLDEGAIDEMVHAFNTKPDCRIVGSVLRFPDGTMQEAGATLQPDGHPIRHGRNDHKFKTRRLPRFQTVDYVSGACMMIRKEHFLEMGGFAEKYSPAYYEDTDLCMRSLLYGQKVYLASRSNCYHIENATTSTIEDGAWASRTAEAHREIFLKDWGAYLTSRDPQDLPRHLAQ